jgi:hypothetical protein
MSVVGWQVMALHSVARLGQPMPAETRKKALAYVHSVTRKGGLASYQRGRGPSATMTAEAIFSRILLGDRMSDAELDSAARYVLKNAPTQRKRDKNEHTYYFWYYASLAMMQVQGKHWQSWNNATRDYLIKLQESRGKEAGSWEPGTRWARIGGRTYSTATATLSLQVYYRYPSYLGKGPQKDK